MDEQNNNQDQQQPEEQPVEQEQPVQQPEEPQQPAAPTEPTITTPASEGIVYASFWERLLAGLIDVILIGIVTGLLASIFGFGRNPEQGVYSNPFQILGWAYWVYMDVKYGATLGKMALKLRVQRADTGENLDWGHAILREIVGKFLSAIALLLGYFWMLWDPKKQTWHDKIGGSVVVKTK